MLHEELSLMQDLLGSAVFKCKCTFHFIKQIWSQFVPCSHVSTSRKILIIRKEINIYSHKYDIYIYKEMKYMTHNHILTATLTNLKRSYPPVSAGQLCQHSHVSVLSADSWQGDGHHWNHRQSLRRCHCLNLSQMALPGSMIWLGCVELCILWWPCMPSQAATEVCGDSAIFSSGFLWPFLQLIVPTSGVNCTLSPWLCWGLRRE